MNEILDDDTAIRACFAHLTSFRGGRLVDFFDFGTNCNVASLHNLAALAPYSHYMLAADLTRSSPNTAIGKRPDDHYATFSTDPAEGVPAILTEMMDSHETAWTGAEAQAWYRSPAALKDGRTLPSWRQQLTLFASRQLASILAAVGGADALKKAVAGLDQKANPDVFFTDRGRTYADLRGALACLHPTYRGFAADWGRFALKQVSNLAGLHWDTDIPRGVLVC